MIALAATLAFVLAGIAMLATDAAGEETSTPPVHVKVPPPPANDTLAGAQAIHSLPASLNGTTVGATTEGGEPGTTCGAGSEHSVWFSLRIGAAHRVALDLAASGELDATVDVYHAVRSQLTSVSCQQTEGEGKASLSFAASKNGLYDIRVAAVTGSQLAPFTLEVFTPTPAVSPPGPPLAPQGASGQVDRIQNVNAAYSVTMHSGVSYLIDLANETKGACVSAALFAPGTRSFGGEEEEAPSGGLAHIQCSGFRLFTPGAGEGGLYSVEVTPRFSYRGIQRFHLQVTPAGPAETAPGVLLGNYGVARGYLDGRTTHVLRLYRMEVTSHSNLTLKLGAPAHAEFKLELLNQDGNVVECACEGGGGPRTLTQQLTPSTYYAVVSATNNAAGSFSLLRQSRTITSTSIAFSSAKVALGQPVSIDVKVTPAVSGPVRVEIQRFDPVFGWQFYREENVVASAGVADVPFAAPNVGKWRAKANYEGSLTASPSAVGHTYLLVE